MDNSITSCIADVHCTFHIMYLFSPLVPEHATKWAWFCDNINDVMDHFHVLVVHGHETNYIHTIQKHAAPVLEQGGLVVYANDNHETLQCLLKQVFHDWTPHHVGQIHSVWCGSNGLCICICVLNSFMTVSDVADNLQTQSVLANLPLVFNRLMPIFLRWYIGHHFPELLPEDPGSKWPKTMLGMLAEGMPPLLLNQLHTLKHMCNESSTPTTPVDQLAVVVYYCASLEKQLISH